MAQKNAAHHYVDGSYWIDRRDSDSTYKARLVLAFFESAGITLPSPLRAAEVGCGQGAFLVPLGNALRDRGIDASLLGLDISPLAIEMARARGEGIDFAVGSSAEVPDGLDVVFCMDVVEHVEDPFGFLRALSGKATYVAIHLPIEQSVAHLLLGKAKASYRLFQHVHFYSWATAQLLLEELPFRLVAHPFSAASMETVGIVPGLWRKTIGLLRLCVYRVAPRMAPLLLGGSVLLLLEDKYVPEASQKHASRTTESCQSATMSP